MTIWTILIIGFIILCAFIFLIIFLVDPDDSEMEKFLRDEQRKRARVK